MKHILSTPCAVLSAALICPTPVLSADAKDVGELVRDVGVSSAKIWLDQSNATVPKSNLEPDQQRTYVENALNDYARIRNTHHGAAESMEWVNVGIKLGSGVAMFAYPPATIPAILYAGAMDTVIDEGNKRIELLGEAQGRKRLALIKDQLVSETGLGSYAAMRDNPEQVRQLLTDSNNYLLDLKERADSTGDPALIDFSIDVLVRTLVHNDEAILDAVVGTISDIEETKKDFSDFTVEVKADLEEVNARLEGFGSAIESLANDTKLLQESMQEVNVRLQSVEQSQGFISDFVLSRMSPSEKVAALKNGFMADRFGCASGVASCDASELKTSMIAQFEAEARLASHIDTAAKISKGISDISTIANNLGISDPKINEALAIGSAAANAFIGFASGNYLGAIASVTGIFGGGSDPDAERFKIMMQYLQQQFEVVNQKLDAILENQEAIFDAIVKVSEQLDERFDAIDQRQFNMFFEQRRTSLGIRSIHWKDWRSCHNVYSAARKRNLTGSYIYTQADTSLFVSFDAISAVAAAQQTNFRECYKEVSAALGSLGAIKWFGNFADARLLYNELSSVPSGTLSPAEMDTAELWRPALQKYIEDVFDPTIALVQFWSAEENISPDSLFSSQTWPYFNADDALKTINIARENPFQCFTGQALYGGTHQYLCQSTVSSSEVALDAIRTPLVADSLIDIADWILVISQVADIYDQATEGFAQDIFEIDGQRLGEPMIEKSIDLLNLGVATYNIIYGYPAVEAINSSFSRGDATAPRALTILNNNQYVAANFVMSMLHQRFDVHAELQGGSEKEIVEVYSSAVKALIDAGSDVPLRNLFGTDAAFLVSDGRPSVRVTTATGLPEITIPLPMPTTFAEERYEFPRRFDELVAKRDQLVDRLASYRLTSSLDDEKLEEFVSVFLADRGSE